MKHDANASRVRRILMVDDHALVRHGLRELLSHVPGIEVCGEAASAQEALRLVESLSPDLVIVDISLEESNGIDLIKRIRGGFPEVRMLVASMHDESLYATRAVQAGAMGYVSKQEPVEKLLEAIQYVLRGEMYLSPAATARMFRVKRTGEKVVGESPLAQLSDRELEVFQAIGEGLSTRAIAERMNLSVKTIETHREHIKRKLSLDSNTELIQRSFRWVLEQE
jgi:DNA-binding NarL/FixJ family response regulator